MSKPKLVEIQLGADGRWHGHPDKADIQVYGTFCPGVTPQDLHEMMQWPHEAEDKPCPFKEGDWVRVRDVGDVIQIKNRRWGTCKGGPNWQYNFSEAGSSSGWYPHYSLTKWQPEPGDKVVVTLKDG